MGAAQSQAVFSSDDIEEILQELAREGAPPVFTPPEIGRLYKRFMSLDKESTGFISSDELLSIPELTMNPLAPRILSLLDKDKRDQINFKQLLLILAAFSTKASTEDKMKRWMGTSPMHENQVAFRLYDVDSDGFISSDDLLQVLRLMTGTYLAEDELRLVVTDTIEQADADADGKLSYQEFSKAMEKADLHGQMSIRF